MILSRSRTDIVRDVINDALSRQEIELMIRGWWWWAVMCKVEMTCRLGDGKQIRRHGNHITSLPKLEHNHR